jgi:O-succinylbenzoate synthase
MARSSRLLRYRLPRREGLLIEWEGRVAEASPLPGRSRETLEEVEEELIEWCRHDTPPTSPAARWALECLSHPLPLRLECETAGYARALGAPTIKLKAGGLTPRQAAALVQRHRGKTIRLDCNRQWSLAQALDFARHFSPTDFAYLEEPLEDPSQLPLFSELTRFPIALDETLLEKTLPTIPTLVAAVVKPTILGGVPSHYPVPVVLSSALESGVGLLHLANAHLRLRLPYPPGLDTLSLIGGDLIQSPTIQGGSFRWEGPLTLIQDPLQTVGDYRVPPQRSR